VFNCSQLSAIGSWHIYDVTICIARHYHHHVNVEKLKTVTCHQIMSAMLDMNWRGMDEKLLDCTASSRLRRVHIVVADDAVHGYRGSVDGVFDTLVPLLQHLVWAWPAPPSEDTRDVGT
jgi:hypothetical protein